MSSVTPRPDALEDEQLSQAGYASELRRDVGGLTAFASSFALISIVVGFLTLYGIAYTFAGPAVAWTIPIVFFGQLLIALVFAELAARYPYAGSIYQWSRRLGGRTWGANTSFTYICAWLLALPSGIVGLQLTLTAISPKFQLVGHGVPGEFDSAFAQNAIIIALVAFTLTTIVNLTGIRAVAVASVIGLIAELAGVTLLIVVLATHLKHGLGASFKTLPHPHKSYLGLFLVGAFLAMYQLFGYDQATQLAEETHDPRRQGPRALLRSFVSAGVLAFVVALLVAMAITKIEDPNIPAGGLPYLLTVIGGSGAGKAFLWIAVVCFLAAGVAGHSLIARMIFSSARDGEILGGEWFAKVSRRTQVPYMAVVFPTAVWTALLLLNLGNPRVFEAIIGGAAVLIYLSYLGVTLPALRARLNDSWSAPEPGLFRLPHGAGTMVAGLAVLWGVAGLVNLLIPRADFYGTEWYQQYSSLLILGIVILLGIMQHLVMRQRQPA